MEDGKEDTPFAVISSACTLNAVPDTAREAAIALWAEGDAPGPHSQGQGASTTALGAW
ncbi:hypothetical protein WJ438_04890 [Streptomyces sp. GD-15H]|uniref:hypothetical protein n=1 Tax=Streptomyces sp. GD-15H TaxID=3129112 RepID=UPI00325483BE